MAKRTRRNPGLLGAISTRDIVLVGLVGGLIYAMTRKPIQTESKVVVDWTSGLRRDVDWYLNGRKS